ncbi:MAG: hypothetical protein KatS3mg126_2413 [Lysobacteraceae bacterium]|nr:MAG: hypothetical protein KatS3mg126_2413 [Xanthomonadaceae bacterium]
MAAPQPEYSPEELHELLTGVMPEIPGYRVLRLLGRGGMAYVYLGIQESLDRQVAIKVIQPEALRDEVSKLRFEREAQIIAKLQHPCIVGIYEIGRTEHGLLYYVLPYLSRGHLGQRDLRNDQHGIVEVLRALLWALDYAHGRGVVHRDVKAENVLFDNADRPLLTDFGIALSRRDRSRVTGHGLAIGSVAHMAPEQARGESVDGRADLYSLGVLTFEMLTGELPFQSPDPLGLALMHATDPIPRLPPQLAHWQALIDRAMAKRPEDRFADAREMMLALDEVEARLTRLGVAPSPTALARQSWQALGNWARAVRERSQPAAAPPPRPPPVTARLRAAAAALPVRLAGLGDRLRQGRSSAAAWLRALAGHGRAAQLGAGLVVLLLAGLALRALWPFADQGNGAPPAAPPAVRAAPAALELAAPAPPAAPALPVAGRPAADGEAAGGVEAAQTDDGSASVEAAAEPEAEPDPLADLPADARMLAFAEAQIRRHRLTQPPGGNAYESLLAAEALAADAQRLRQLGLAWLEAATPYIVGAIERGDDDTASKLLERGRELATPLAAGGGRAGRPARGDRGAAAGRSWRAASRPATSPPCVR